MFEEDHNADLSFEHDEIADVNTVINSYHDDFNSAIPVKKLIDSFDNVAKCTSESGHLKVYLRVRPI